MNPSRSYTLALLMITFLFGSVGLSKLLTLPPAPLPETAPANQFSASRAVIHIDSLSKEIHPIGSAAQVPVREYILSQISSCKLHPDLQSTFSVQPRNNTAGQVVNILARMEGSANEDDAILLMAHYDSANTSPGANDDSAGVGVLLEIMRIICPARGEDALPLSNDVIFLFSDGEESASLGTKGFYDEHPWAKDVRLVLNLDVRGVSGPAYLYETGQGNLDSINGFALAASRPAANSFLPILFQFLPIETGYQVFKEAGIPGYTFAYLGGASHYHTALDSTLNINAAGIQQMGENALGLLAHFRNIDLSGLSSGPGAPSAVYFDLLNRFTFYYPTSWSRSFAFILLLAWLSLFFWGRSERLVTYRRTLLGLLAFLLSVIGSATFAWLVWRITCWIFPAYANLPLVDLYNASVYAIALSTAGLIAFSLLFLLFREWIALLDFIFGVQFGWVILALGTAFIAPAASFVITWPLVGSLLGTLFLLSPARPGTTRLTRRNTILLSFFSLPTILIFVPLLESVFTGLTLRQPLPGLILLLLAAGLFLPHLEVTSRPYPYLLPIILGILFVLAYLYGGITSSFTPERPRPDQVIYGLDASTGSAYWITSPISDEWTAQFVEPGELGSVSAFYPALDDTLFTGRAAAPILNFPAPQATLLDERVSGEQRILDLNIRSLRKADQIRLFVNEPQENRSILLNGKELIIDDKEDPASMLVIFTPPEEGVNLSISIPASEEVRLTVIDLTYNLPRFDNFDYQSRPATFIQQPGWTTDTTMVSQSFTFPAP